MFEKGRITAYPTDTSYGFGVRIDDTTTLQALADLKGGREGKYFSIMVRDMDMLKVYAQVPEDFPEDFFTQKPRTAILKPQEGLPKTSFWPAEKVAFRICTLPEVAMHIEIPVTATSANKGGEASIYNYELLNKKFVHEQIFCSIKKNLPITQPSEIWDFTESEPLQIRG